MIIEKIKQCPFCGSYANLVADQNKAGAFVKVRCFVCEAETKGIFLPEGKYSSGSLVETIEGQKAIWWWNSRVEGSE